MIQAQQVRHRGIEIVDVNLRRARTRHPKKQGCPRATPVVPDRQGEQRLVDRGDDTLEA